jgi:hypothetical protein
MLTPADINEHIRKRNLTVDRDGNPAPQNYLPLCDTASNAMILFSFFGNYSWRNTNYKPEGFVIPIRLAIKCEHDANQFQRDELVRKFMNAMRSALSHVRNTMKIHEPNKELTPFKILYRGYNNHVQNDIIIINLEYTESEVKKTIKRLFKTLALDLKL